jgi:methionine-rich copper-binding protein CopC
VKAAAVLVAALAFGLVQAGPARAHAERSVSTPQEGARVTSAPEELSVTFTEPPTGDATVSVLDGCGRDVVADVVVQNFDVTAPLSAGEPGTWRVETNVISAVDGHNTRDRWSFRVRGEPDCSAPASDAPDAAPGDEEDGGGGVPMPLIVLVGATIVLVVLGFALRGRGG